MNQDDKLKSGVSSFVIRIVAYIILAITIFFKLHPAKSFEWISYLTWICYPLFAFLLTEGFEQSTSKKRYFLRLLLFAIISEIPYNLLMGGKLFYPQAQNGMFTLILGFIAISIVYYIYDKTANLILWMASLYIYGWGAFHISKMINAEFWSFGVMFVMLFYISNQIKYPKILQIVFMIILSFYLSSSAYLNFVIGNYMYTLPFRSLCVPAVILTWFYQGKRGPNGLKLQIANYAFYPVILAIAAFVKLVIIK